MGKILKTAKKYLAWTALAPLALTIDCGPRAPTQTGILAGNTGASAQPQPIFELWARHVADANAKGPLQSECVPTHFAPPVGQSTRGIVVLVHGFTACPQQFFVIGQRVAQAGFDVFLPLLPGHGLVPSEVRGSDGYALDRDEFYPRAHDQDRYQRLVETINGMARASQGVKVLGGLSGGGSLATAALVEGRDLWQRGLIYAPLYKSPGMAGPLSALLNVLYPSYKRDWGEDCKKGRNQPGGRHGYCMPPVDSLRAMVDWSRPYSKRTSEIQSTLMFVGTEEDSTVDNRQVLNAHQAAPRSHLCFYPKGVPHAMVSRLDHVGEPLPWMDALERDSVNFIVSGQIFETDPGVKSSEYGQSRCRIGGA